MFVELSATEAANQRRFGRAVAASIVELYAVTESARADGISVTAKVHDVSDAEVKRVAQLAGALIDAGCSHIEFLGAAGVATELRAALQAARIRDDYFAILGVALDPGA